MAEQYRNGPNPGHSSPSLGGYARNVQGQGAAYGAAPSAPPANSGMLRAGDPGLADPGAHVDFQPQYAPQYAPQYTGHHAPAQAAAQAPVHASHAPTAYAYAAQDHAPTHTQGTYTEGGYSQNAYAQDHVAATHAPKLGAAQWGGAIISLALICGLGIWGTQLMMRDVRGVPVIRALEGEARIVPDDPGGQLAMHQGLAVNSVTADGSAAAPADQLTLAPRNTGLADEDQPMGAMEPVLTAYTPQTDAYAVQPEENLQQVAVEADPLELKSVEPVAAETPEATPLVTTAGLQRSPRPAPRPVRVAALRPAATPSATPQTAPQATTDGPSLDAVAGDLLAAVSASGELTATDIPVGTRLVQFGAFESETVARTEWDRMQAKFGDMLEGKSRVIEEAISGGSTFYRLRAAGFADASDTNRFCAALMAMNAQCVPTVQR